MKKLVLFLLVCASILNTVHSMEQSTDVKQPLDLAYLLETCPNTLVSHLDGQTLSSLMQVSKLFLAHCDAVPTKYLTITFSDVTKHGSKKMLNRFHEYRDTILIKRLTQFDNWILGSKMGEEITAYQKNDGTNIIKGFKISFDENLERLFGGHDVLCFTQNDKATCYIVMSLAACHQWIMCLKVDEYNDTMNQFLITFLHKKGVGVQSPAISRNGSIFVSRWNSIQHINFALTNTSHSLENRLKQFELITIFLIATEKNNAPIIDAILKNTIIDSWSSNLLFASLRINDKNEHEDAMMKIYHMKHDQECAEYIQSKHTKKF